MVESEVPIDAALLPETPAGYAAPRQFHYPTVLLLVGSAAPLVAITAFCTPLLVVPVPLIAAVALVALVVNASGAIGDLYAAWRIDRLPPGTLLYDADIRHFYVYEPLDAA